VIAAPEPSMTAQHRAVPNAGRVGKSLRKVEVTALWRFLLDDLVAIP
jgi:hypothetical protein